MIVEHYLQEQKVHTVTAYSLSLSLSQAASRSSACHWCKGQELGGTGGRLATCYPEYLLHCPRQPRPSSTWRMRNRAEGLEQTFLQTFLAFRAALFLSATHGVGFVQLPTLPSASANCEHARSSQWALQSFILRLCRACSFLSSSKLLASSYRQILAALNFMDFGPGHRLFALPLCQGSSTLIEIKKPRVDLKKPLEFSRCSCNEAAFEDLVFHAVGLCRSRSSRGRSCSWRPWGCPRG